MRPELPPELAQRYKLGTLCARGHGWNGTGYSLRKKSNGGCKQCQDALVQRQLPRRRPATPEVPEKVALEIPAAANTGFSTSRSKSTRPGDQPQCPLLSVYTYRSP